jgi:Pentapeptide repeats (8 copies)
VRQAFVTVVAAALLLTTSSGSAGGAAAACKPGSGPNLTHRKLTQDSFSNGTNISCANLSGVDLSGFDLTQVTLPGADFSDANLSGTTFTQATLTGADFSGANLSSAQLGQAEAQGANFSGANMQHAQLVQMSGQGANFDGADLTGADLGQAELTDANLDQTKLGGASFVQTTLTGATFKGATGVTPYSLFLLIGCAVVFVLLAWRPIRRLTNGSSGVGGALLGLLGAFLVAAGLHLFVGGILDEAVGGFGTPISQTCSTGVFCSVGVRSGFMGLWAGIFAIIIGFVLRAAGGGGGRSRVRMTSMYGG